MLFKAELDGIYASNLDNLMFNVMWSICCWRLHVNKQVSIAFFNALCAAFPKLLSCICVPTDMITCVISATQCNPDCLVNNLPSILYTMKKENKAILIKIACLLIYKKLYCVTIS